MTTIDTVRPAVRMLRHRWPTLAALLTPLVITIDAVRDFAPMLMVLPTIYVLTLATGGRRWTWPLVLVSLGAYVALRDLGPVDPRTALLVVAGAALGVAIVRHRDRREVALQAAGLVVFGGLSFAAAVAAPQAAVWLLAAAWLGHGIWDLVHLRRGAVVCRSFAEWCGVLDVLTAAVIVLGATSWLA